MAFVHAGHLTEVERRHIVSVSKDTGKYTKPSPCSTSAYFGIWRSRAKPRNACGGHCNVQLINILPSFHQYPHPGYQTVIPREALQGVHQDPSSKILGTPGIYGPQYISTQACSPQLWRRLGALITIKEKDMHETCLFLRCYC